MGPNFTFSGIKEKVFDSSTLAYICLYSCIDSSSLVSICLRSSSDLSKLIYTRLMTRLHSPTSVCDLSKFVYTRLHLSNDLSVFLEQIVLFYEQIKLKNIKMSNNSLIQFECFKVAMLFYLSERRKETSSITTIKERIFFRVQSAKGLKTFYFTICCVLFKK